MRFFGGMGQSIPTVSGSYESWTLGLNSAPKKHWLRGNSNQARRMVSRSISRPRLQFLFTSGKILCTSENEFPTETWNNSRCRKRSYDEFAFKFIVGFSK